MVLSGDVCYNLSSTLTAALGFVFLFFLMTMQVIVSETCARTAQTY